MLRKKWMIKNVLASVLILLFFGPLNAAVQKGPYLIYDGVKTGMTVLWQLDTTQSCTVDWGEDTSYATGTAATTENGGATYEHQHIYTITGLTPGTQYFYQVNCDSDEVGNGSFRTAPLDDADSVKFIVYGDTRTNPADHDAVNYQMINTYTTDPEYQTITLHVGDWVCNDLEADWANEFFDPYYTNINEFQANMPLNGVRGNHEGFGDLFFKYFPYPYEAGGFYWSFDYGPAHIIVIDQYVDYSPGSTQYMWLENDLASSTKKWKFLLFHEPGWSAGGSHSNNVDVQNYIQPLAVENGVYIIFAGHNHYYARAVVDGIQHITTGGGGAPLRTPDPNYENVVVTAKSHHFCEIEIQGDNLYFTARDKSGLELDSFHINQGTAPVITLQSRVSASADDAEERANGSMYLNSSDLELVFDQDLQTVGICFSDLAIPENAIITKAYIQFKVDETSSENVQLTIHGENRDNAPGFANTKYNISSRTKTAVSVSWSPLSWNTIGAAGEFQRTSDLTSIVQEIVSWSGWGSGNAMAFIITGADNTKRVAESYDGDQAGAPLLYVEYRDVSTIAPVITLIGDNPMNLNVGDTFSDPGATAQDTPDGNLTSSIQTTSNVNTAVADTYTVTYTVTDSDGNSVSVTRSVVVSDYTDISFIVPVITLILF